MAKELSEYEDQQLVDSLVFCPNGLTLSKIAGGAGHTPDFRVYYEAKLVAYCELKSPRDEWIDQQFEAVQPASIVGGHRNDPTFNRIRRLTRKAADQFRAVNMDRTVPSALVFVNHDEAAAFGDMLETFTGLFYASDGSRHVTLPHVASSLERDLAHIDICIWISSKEKRVEGYLFNEGTSPSHVHQLCSLLGLDQSKIRR